MVRIGTFYYYGKNGIAINHEEAFKWYAKAADEGDSDGMWRLGMCYENGMGVNMDWDMAREWYEKASKLGNKKAKNALDNLDLPF